VSCDLRPNDPVFYPARWSLRSARLSAALRGLRPALPAQRRFHAAGFSLLRNHLHCLRWGVRPVRRFLWSGRQRHRCPAESLRWSVSALCRVLSADGTTATIDVLLLAMSMFAVLPSLRGKALSIFSHDQWWPLSSLLCTAMSRSWCQCVRCWRFAWVDTTPSASENQVGTVEKMCSLQKRSWKLSNGQSVWEEERNLQLSEEGHQMGSGFPRWRAHHCSCFATTVALLNTVIKTSKKKQKSFISFLFTMWHSGRATSPPK